MFESRFVRTDPKVGLQPADADRLIALLNDVEASEGEEEEEGQGDG